MRMSTRLARPGVTVLLLLFVGATALAQRGGYQGTSSSYTGNARYDGRFTFVRISYPDNFGGFGRRGGGPFWAHDYPRGEEHFLKILGALTSVPLHVEEHNIMSLSDPDLFKFPVIYLCEPGSWTMNDSDAAALRAFLQKGGFMIIDDMRYQQWTNLEYQMARVLPQGRWEDIGVDHPIFHSFYEIPQPDNIPQYYDPGKPIFRGMYEDNDRNKRLMVFVNYNTDISEFWEWSDTGYRPIDENNEAYKLGINEFMYGIIH
jgi:Domain of unknown function (DUF4159)